MHDLLNSIFLFFTTSEPVMWFMAELMGKSIILLANIYLFDRFLLERKPLLSDRLWRLVPSILLFLPFVVVVFPQINFFPAPYPSEDNQLDVTVVELDKFQDVSAASASQVDGLATVSFPRLNQISTNRNQLSRSTAMIGSSVGNINGFVLFMLCTYLIITAFLLLRLFVSLLAVGRIHRSAEPANIPVWCTQVIMQQKRLGISSNISFRHSAIVQAPLTYGIFNPTIIVPTKLLNIAAPKTIDAILLHELTHIARADYLMQISLKLTQAFYWCNPFVWFALGRVSELREVICDGFTVSVMKDRQEYIDILLDQAHKLVPPSDKGLSLAMSGTSNFEKRLHSLKYVKVNSFLEKRRVSVIMAGFVFLVTSFLGTMGVADANSLTKESNRPRGITVISDSDSILRYMDERQTERLFNRQEDDTNDENAIIRCWMSGSGEKDWCVVVDRDSGIKGHVFDTNGRPLIGVEVMAVRKVIHAKLREPVEVYVKTRTDAAGFYKLFLEPDRYELRARVDRIGSFLQKGKQVQKNSFDEIDMHLKPTATFRAKFVDSVTLLPVAGMRLKSWEPKGLQGISGSNGEMVIRNVFAKNIQFSVTGKDGSNKGRGVAGEYGRWWSKEASFEYQKLTKQPARFQRNFDRLNFNVTKSMKPVTIFLEPCVTVRGRVFDPHGDPVLGATVSPARTGTGNSLTGDGRYMFRTNMKGEYELRMPASHEAYYNLVAHDGKYNKWRSWANGVGGTIQTKPGDVLDNVELHLTFPGSVSGQVVDAQGEIQAGVEVKAIPQDMKQNRYLFPQAICDSKGRYHFQFLRPGKYWFVASRYAADIRLYDASDVQEVEVQGNKTQRNVTLKKTDRLKKVN